jgi:hypothetical protein
MDNDISSKEDKSGQMFFRAMSVDLILQIRCSASTIDKYSFRALTFVDNNSFVVGASLEHQSCSSKLEC